MSAKYIFYDLETTGRGKKEYPSAFGTTPKWEQIMQIAAIVTDENFQETNQNIKDAIAFASATAGLSTTKIGTANSMPSREEIDKIL